MPVNMLIKPYERKNSKNECKSGYNNKIKLKIRRRCFCTTMQCSKSPDARLVCGVFGSFSVASHTGQCCAVNCNSTSEELVIRGNFCPCQTPVNFSQVCVSLSAFVLKTAKLEFVSI